MVATDPNKTEGVNSLNVSEVRLLQTTKQLIIYNITKTPVYESHIIFIFIWLCL